MSRFETLPLATLIRGGAGLVLAVILLAFCACTKEASSGETESTPTSNAEQESDTDSSLDSNAEFDAGTSLDSDAGLVSDAGPDSNADSDLDEGSSEAEKEAEQEEVSSEDAAVQDDENPFRQRIDVEYEFPQDTEWLNTGGAIRMRDLKGKFVLFDFWTYCCINCIHVLPVLNKIEQKYPNEVVVIGVHSAKFETEKDTENIKEAILRYKIEHPVINDDDHQIWDTFGVRSWPTLLMFDPEGKAVFMKSGEAEFEELDAIFQAAIPYYQKQGTLDETPIQFELHAFAQPSTPLRFPGKVLADEASDRLYIADSNHNRIVVTTLAGELIETIGTGAVGTADGAYDAAEFNQPQGMALRNGHLIVSDTENHLMRSVNLEAKSVSTIAGLGYQGRNAFPGLEDLGPFDEPPERWVGAPTETALNSPWAVVVHNDDLYIAMAGPHQIWKMNAEGTEIGPYAGNGREDIVDGPLVPPTPYELGYSSFAQPSGLASDGTWIYVADSEGSSIRGVPIDPEQGVKTVVGTAELPFNRLFEFGDVDGAKEDVKLQHPLGVVFKEGMLYITDTYNNKVKRVNAETGETVTIAGTGEPGVANEPAQFDEPAGLGLAGGTLYIADTNNHTIRTVDIETGQVGTLEIEGLRPPNISSEPERRIAADAAEGEVPAGAIKSVDGHAEVVLQLELPEGWKLNELAPMSYVVIDETLEGIIDNSALADDATRLANPSDEVSIKLPLLSGSGSDEIEIGLNFYYCQEGGEGLCKIGSVKWKIPLEVSNDSADEKLILKHTVSDTGN